MVRVSLNLAKNRMANGIGNLGSICKCVICETKLKPNANIKAQQIAIESDLKKYLKLKKEQILQSP